MSPMIKFNRTISLALLVLMTVLVLHAQSVDQKIQTKPIGKLSGLILDSGNARVPGAKITVEREGFLLQIVSDDNGRYEIDLPIDVYAVTAMHDGFYPSPNLLVQIRSRLVTNLNVILNGVRLEEDFVPLEEIRTNTEVPVSTIQSRQLDPLKFDEWHDLVFSDEKARLDNVSIAWRDRSRNVIYLVVYAGNPACVGEAKSRGVRAKNYLIKRKVPASKIVWIDGGWKNEVTTEVWIWPQETATPPIYPESIKSTNVTLEKGCRIKYRGSSK